jgi:ABC-type Fe3+-hydroxamate transport system substrate-binding protein
MKKSMLILACAAIAPFAFAQTSTTTEKTTTAPATTKTETSTTYSSGTVTTYEAGKTIVVKGPEGPIDFVLGTTARILDGAGKIVTAPLRAGQKVRVYYTPTGEKKVVERVVVEE